MHQGIHGSAACLCGGCIAGRDYGIDRYHDRVIAGLKAVGVKVIVDHAIKHKTPVFVMGNVEELEKLWETLPKQMFTDIFIRPINVRWWKTSKGRWMNMIK
jgi:hypothetical protein